MKPLGPPGLPFVGIFCAATDGLCLRLTAASSGEAVSAHDPQGPDELEEAGRV